LQCVAVCCRVLQCVVRHPRLCHSSPQVVLQHGAACCVTTCYCVLDACVAVRCSVLQCVVRRLCHFFLPRPRVCYSVLQRVVLQRVTAFCMCVLRHVAVCCSVLQCVELPCIALQCVSLCCSVIQYVAACCSVLQSATHVSQTAFDLVQHYHTLFLYVSSLRLHLSHTRTCL